MTLRKQYIPENKYHLKSPGVLTTRQGIVVHNTATAASAAAEADYVTNNGTDISYHAVVDEKEVVEVLPLNRIAHHAGSYQANRSYIGVEIARSTSDRYPLAEARAIQYLGYLLVTLKLPLLPSSLVKHRDLARTSCPHRIEEGRWPSFVASVLQAAKAYQEGKTDTPIPKPTTPQETPPMRGQRWLNKHVRVFGAPLVMDGDPGRLTYRAATMVWQHLIGAGVDGIIGSETVQKTWNHILREGCRGRTVEFLQAVLCLHGYEVEIDGIFGRLTYRALVALQRKIKVDPDGIWGAQTMKHALTR